MCIRPDFDASPVLPEWTEGCTASQSAYWRVGADARPVLRLTLAVLALDAPTTVQVKATAQGDGLLGSLDAQNVTLAAVGDVTVDFPLAHHALGAADLGSHNVLFQWRAGDKLLGSTKHEVHVLAARPLSRWSNEPGKGELPALPAIRMAEAVQAQESGEEEANRRFCGQFVAWARAEAAAGKLVGRPWADGPAFVHWDKQHRNLLFDIVSFFRAYAAPPVAVGALDLAGLELALARMEGLAEVRLAELSGLAGTGGLMVRAAYRLGETAVERSLTAATYPVACVKDGSHDRIYDAYLEPVDASGARGFRHRPAVFPRIGEDRRGGGSGRFHVPHAVVRAGHDGLRGAENRRPRVRDAAAPGHQPRVSRWSCRRGVGARRSTGASSKRSRSRRPKPVATLSVSSISSVWWSTR